MSRVVLDVSMSADGFTARPNMREAEPMGTAANASTWMAGNGPDSQIDVAIRRALDASVGAAVQRAEQAAGDNDVLVLGVDVAGQLLTAAVLGELRLHRVPLLSGAGTPLFDGGTRPS
jgi:hypothetical protein